MQSLLLVARDEDAYEFDAATGAMAPAQPLWVVANISPAEASNLGGPSGSVIVPYHGPHFLEDEVHRIFFRLYALGSSIPKHQLNSWSTLSRWMASTGPGPEANEASAKEGRLSEFLFTAVHRKQDPSQLALPQPLQLAPSGASFL